MFEELFERRRAWQKDSLDVYGVAMTVAGSGHTIDLGPAHLFHWSSILQAIDGTVDTVHPAVEGWAPEELCANDQLAAAGSQEEQAGLTRTVAQYYERPRLVLLRDSRVLQTYLKVPPSPTHLGEVGGESCGGGPSEVVWVVGGGGLGGRAGFDAGMRRVARRSVERHSVDSTRLDVDITKHKHKPGVGLGQTDILPAP